MDEARTSPPIEINGSRVIKIDDYQSSSSYDTTTNSTSVINIPKANVLIFTTEDGSRIALRPSGTEPKIKYYISVNKVLKTASEFESTELELEVKINKILKAMNLE